MLYREMTQLNMDCVNIAAKIIGGLHAGEQALISNGAVVWESGEESTFEWDRMEWKIESDTQILEHNGDTIFLERLSQEKKIVICGGGHVAAAIAHLSRFLGLPVTLVEDRPEFADHFRKKGEINVISDSYEHALSKLKGDSGTFFIIATRGHGLDQICLEHILQKQYAYVGMLGSRIKAENIRKNLVSKGFLPQVLDTVHSPVGFKIGAETPQEIAVSILAEMIEVKNRKGSTGGYSEELLNEILYTKGDKILCTIIDRTGSTPRSEGTKMLVRSDGTVFGTVGGGSVEAAAMEKAKHMLCESDRSKPVLKLEIGGCGKKSDMDCGGRVKLLLELITG